MFGVLKQKGQKRLRLIWNSIWRVFEYFNVNLRKSEGFLTSISCTPNPERGRSNAPFFFR